MTSNAYWLINGPRSSGGGGVGGGGAENNKGADQPAHPRRLISTFIIRFLESIVTNFATSEIPIS